MFSLNNQILVLMWKPSKTTLFILMLSMTIVGGIAFSLVNWEVVESKGFKGVYNELSLPILGLVLGFYFMVHYVKKLKETEK